MNNWDGFLLLLVSFMSLVAGWSADFIIPEKLLYSSILGLPVAEGASAHVDAGFSPASRWRRPAKVK